MDEKILSDLERKFEQLSGALRAYGDENRQLRRERQALLKETTRLHEEVLRLQRVRRESLSRVRSMQERLRKLEEHVTF